MRLKSDGLVKELNISERLRTHACCTDSTKDTVETVCYMIFVAECEASYQMAYSWT
jgi:hypothetical protein